MEIIDVLEPGMRRIDPAGVGYPGFSGDLDLAIAIRIAVVGGVGLGLLVAGSEAGHYRQKICSRARVDVAICQFIKDWNCSNIKKG